MKKRRIIIAHGWNDSPVNAWMAWLTGELEARGFEVLAPALPRPHAPSLETWLETLRTAVGELDSNTTLVAHSLGTPTVLRLLNDYPKDVKIAGLVLVAGFGDGIRERPGVLFTPPLDFARISARVRSRICIYSNNDRVVSPKRSKRLAQWLNAKEVVVLGGGHFMGLSRLPGTIDRLPAALEAVLSCYPRGVKGFISRLWLR